MLPHFKQHLEKYADLIVAVGINVKKGHTVVLQIIVYQQELTHLIVKKAYALGAAEVLVNWSDETVSREFLLHGADERLTNIPDYRKSQADDWVAKGASRISVVSSNPDALAGVDSSRVAKNQAALGKAVFSVRQATQANKVSWTVVAASSPGWAKKVFPNLPTEEAQVDALWDEIFKTTRIYAADVALLGATRRYA